MSSDSSSRRWTSARLWPALILLSGLIIGIGLSDDFGISLDEPIQTNYAKQVIRIYRGHRDIDPVSNLEYYGPAFSVISQTSVDKLRAIWPTWQEPDVRHFTYFLSFLIAVISLYALTLRYVGTNVAALATLLFASQPLLFGHAFINPKDTPFMAFFLASMATGFAAADSFRQDRQPTRESTLRHVGLQWVRDWRAASRVRRAVLLVLIGGGVLLAFDLLVSQRLFELTQSLVESAYRGEAWGPINTLFQQIAQDAWKTPADLYLEKAARLYAWGQALGVGLTVAVWALVSRSIFDPAPARSWLRDRRGPIKLAAAAATLGFCTSIRVAGPFAGALVSALFLLYGRRRAVTPLIVYWGTAAIITYLSWPFLWGSPIEHFAESVQKMASFQWRGDVLYGGRLFKAADLPWDYVPFLLLAQITLPATLLAGIGMLVSILGKKRGTFLQVEMALIALWLLLPLAGAIALGANLYDNTRQLLFILPPIFIFGGIGLQSLFQRIQRQALRVAAAGVILVPGVIAILSLHPYEYVYYNALVNGVGGAYGRYELDYWCTSLREAMAYINSTAQPNSTVAVLRLRSFAAEYARQDLNLIDFHPDPEASTGQPFYIVVCERGMARLAAAPEAPVVWEVERQGASLTAIKWQP